MLRTELAPSLIATVGTVLWLHSSAQAKPATITAEERQPRNIYELVYSFNHTFKNILNAEEWKLYTARSPELYERISHDVRAWTDLWIHHVRTSLVTIPEKRLNTAHRAADLVDGILRTHFKTKGWPYKSLRVVFLPPRVFLDERHRENLTSGMFIPFYPEAFFVSVDWPVPMKLVLVHESLHFNETGAPFGQPLKEAITETGARYLVLQYELLTQNALRRAEAYERERKGVELILEEIMSRTKRSREEATELFLEAYLTGRQDEMNKVFGAEIWKRVIELSRSQGAWQTHRIKKALEGEERVDQ